MSNNEPNLSWTSHPLRDYPLTSIILILFIIVLSAGLWQIAVVSWDMPLFFYLGMGIFCFSLITYFIPTNYEFYEDKIVIYYFFIRIERKYSDFGCFYLDKKGVMLSTFKTHRRLDSFRGQSVRFSKTRAEKDELLKLLKDKIGNQV
ncbi:MAG: hypothetical protein K8R49_04525 [Candidatus Cloacimonetes bacterium]|nr:hypothetical protein [Candidatus Cloacimonadota bacterium]